MDEFTPAQIIAILKEEKSYLEELLETVTDEFKRQTSKERITEIVAYLAQHLKPPKPQADIKAKEYNPTPIVTI